MAVIGSWVFVDSENGIIGFVSDRIRSLFPQNMVTKQLATWLIVNKLYCNYKVANLMINNAFVKCTPAEQIY